MKRGKMRVSDGARDAQTVRPEGAQHGLDGEDDVHQRKSEGQASTGQENTRKATPKKAKDDGKGEGILRVRSHAERAALLEKFCKITGTTTERGAERILAQMASMQVWGRGETDEQRILAAAELIADLGPANATEALLAVQMFGVHEAALQLLQRATLQGQTFEGCDANVLRATKLMRVFIEQLDAMAKLKGKAAQQKVTVEHVHVHEGGQAIVGAVSAAKADPGEGGK
ncbi:MAG TPA: hypothetical protein VE959_29085 [Bryobacteraceae bacterium]|nr:hypothetical protein [Bryobacteraceae bacterium]